MIDFIIAIISFCLAHNTVNFILLYISLYFFTVFAKHLIKEFYQPQESENKEEKANKYNCKNCIHYGNFEAFYGEVYACELYECHYKRKKVSE